MENSTAAVWRETFANWPPQFRRKGVVIPSFGEPTAFVDFVMTKDIIVLERATPDGAGGRRIAIPFSMIGALKYIEPLKTEQFLNAGFVKGSEQSPSRGKPRSAPIRSVTPDVAPLAPTPPLGAT
jgi:hypothetical protein